MSFFSDLYDDAVDRAESARESAEGFLNDQWESSPAHAALYGAAEVANDARNAAQSAVAQARQDAGEAVDDFQNTVTGLAGTAADTARRAAEEGAGAIRTVIITWAIVSVVSLAAIGLLVWWLVKSGALHDIASLFNPTVGIAGLPS